MPQYQCYKKVWALKIAEVKHVPPPEFSGALCRGSVVLGTACGDCERCKWYADGNRPKTLLVPAEPGYGPVEASESFLTKHKPVAGGYFVVYEDGYQSFSPSQAFEDGYTRL